MISVFATSIRPQYWERFYTDIQEATTHPFEIVFTSPKSPLPNMPDNFRIIQTDVKPAQAMEAAFRQCRYPYVVQTVDDIKFDPLALDELLALVQKNERVIATCKYGIGYRDGTCAQTEGIFGLCEWPERATIVPLQPVCPMFLANAWKSVGGIDPIFGASYGDLDVFLRLIAAGWTVMMTLSWVREREGGSDLWRTKGQNDLKTIRNLWRDKTPAGNWTGKRMEPAGSFDDATILTQNQGRVW